MKSARSLPVHLLLLLYILISGTYQVVAAVSLVVGFFDLRHQVEQPFEVGYNPPTISSVTEAAQKAGLATGDVIESLNAELYWGRALLQKVRWYARPGDTMQLGVRPFFRKAGYGLTLTSGKAGPPGPSSPRNSFA